MPKLNSCVFFLILLLNGVMSLHPDSKYFKFLDDKTKLQIDELFTFNIGIVNLRYIGNINTINPIDSDNAILTIKNILSEIPAVKLNKKSSVLKAIRYYNQKKNPQNSKDKIDIDMNLIERKFYFSDTNIDNSIIYEVFLKFKKDTDFNTVAKLWFENHQNPFYTPLLSSTITRQLKDEKSICDANKTARGTLDMLITGDIEKIENLYILTFYVYSRLLDKRIATFSVVSDSERLSEKVRSEFKKIIPDIFNIKYASLIVDTTDDEVKIFLDGDYLGRKSIAVDFLVPKKYVLTLTKENFNEKKLNITLSDFESKEIFETIDVEKELQVINFYIEPLGSKIFINSIYQGKSPFKRALPIGNYIISAKNDLFENYRYTLNINEVQNEEKTIIFHLKSKDINSQFKIKRTLYYVSFWNFSFSLMTMVPTLIFAYDYFYKYGAAQEKYMNNNPKPTKEYYLTKEGRILYNAYIGTYAAAAVLLAYTGLSIAWLFFNLANYIMVLEKKDFIPILEFYQTKNGDDGITIGAQIKIN